MMSRYEDYTSLVAARKSCMLCQGLRNPTHVLNGQYDSDQIGPWTLWQGNLNTTVMLVGQDWGDVRYFTANTGHEAPRNPTNETLVKLLDSIGITIAPPTPQDNSDGEIFLTNAILCLKQDGLQGAVRPEWFQNCGRHFLKPTIDLIQPKILLTLGEGAHRVIRDLYGLSKMTFKNAVAEKFRLNATTDYFPMYHCGQRILNTHRKFDQQLKDWERLKHALNAAL
jgi:uracil-DNA glycosylase family 4